MTKKNILFVEKDTVVYSIFSNLFWKARVSSFCCLQATGSQSNRAILSDKMNSQKQDVTTWAKCSSAQRLLIMATCKEFTLTRPTSASSIYDLAFPDPLIAGVGSAS